MTGRSDGITAVNHSDLGDDDLGQLRQLFNRQYFDDYGPWSPDEPYGYAGHDVHVLATRAGALIGHVGWGRRQIRVGSADVVIGGVGGVLVASSARKTAVGRRLMDAAIRSMRDAGNIDFGYLGCREAVAPFYASCGWTRIAAREAYTDRLTGELLVEDAGPPLFVTGVRLGESEWPLGDIDLRGKPW